MKRVLKKIGCLLVVLSMVLAYVPAEALAIALPMIQKPVLMKTQTVIIPAPMDPDQQIRTMETYTQQVDYVPLAQEEYLTDYAEAGAILREAMKNRDASVTIPFEMNFDESFQDVVNSICAAAVVHTGEPTEGDYIAKQRGRIGAQGTFSPDADEFQCRITFSLEYYTTAEQEAEVDIAVANLLDSLDLDGKTDYEKIRAVYDWLCANITYDYDNLNDPSYELKYTAYAALINRTSVCQGYAVLFYRLILELGIDCRVITGLGNGGAHAWNIVELGGLYYNLDATWDASWHQAGLPYNFFLRADDTFEDHVRDTEFDNVWFHVSYPMTRTDFDPNASCIHNYISVVKEPTCTEQGYTTRTCEYCGDSYVENYRDAYGHSIGDWITTVEPTETTYGHQYRECWSCGYTEERDILLYPEYVNTMLFSTDGIAYLHDCYGQVKKTYTGWMTEVYEIEDDYSISAGGYMTTAPWFFDGYGAERVIIEDGVAPVSTAHWFDCWYELTTVTIPASVTTMGFFMFHGCDNLEEIWFKGDAPTFDEAVFAEHWEFDDPITIYYPVANATWTDVVLHDFGRPITWVSYVPEDVQDNIVDFGTFGDNLTWKLTNDGTLTISGTGEMPTEFNAAVIPWSKYADSVTSVVIEEGVTSVSRFAFTDFSCLVSVTLPNGMISIDLGAFNACESLESINIPNTVTSIGDGVFQDCYALREVAMGNGVVSIGYGAFANCSSLVNISLPNSLTHIDQCAFYWCTSLTSIVIPDSVVEMGDMAFEKCTNLKSVVLSASLTSIPSSCFFECDSLTSITIPASITSIGSGAFGFANNLTEFIFEGDAPSIDESAFNALTATAYYPFDNPTWTVEKLRDYGGHISWIPYGSGNEEVIIDSGTCGPNLIWKLTDDGVLIISGTGDMSNYTSNEPAPWSDHYVSITALKMDNTVTSIGDNAFNSCANLTGVIIPQAVTRIGQAAFLGCTGLTDITIPNSVITIDNGAFLSCTGLTSVTMGMNVTSLGDFAFADCPGLTEIIIPNSVTSIGFSAFKVCTGLTQITIPGTVKTIGDYAFAFCSGLANVTIGDGVNSLGEYAFSGCTALTQIDIPDSVTSMGMGAFSECSGLVTVNIGSGLTSIANWAFSYCTSLMNVNMGSVTEIGGIAFLDCTSLISVTIPDTVTGIGNEAFSDCTALTIVTIGQNVTDIGNYAFDGCTNLWHILYKGTESQWNGIAIGYNNEPLFTAIRHNNCIGTEVTDLANKSCKICDCEHVWDEGTVTEAPRCTIPGMMTYTCIKCGFTRTEELAPTGHTEVIVTGYPASCTTDGLTDGSYCEVCETILKFQNVISATGHSYTYVVTEPTCTQQGYTTGTCTECGDICTIDVVDSLGHDFGEWYVETQPGEYNGGQERRDCKRCDHYETNYLPPVGHTHQYEDVVTAPTCTEQGYTTHTCQCGESYVDSYVDALGHDFGEWYVETQPGEYNGGQERRDCKRCDHYETNYLPPVGHTHQYEDVVTAPTCTEQGYTTHTCQCGESYVDSYVDALGHNFGDWEVITAPTLTTPGSETRTCLRCGVAEDRTIPPLGSGEYAEGTLVFRADGIAYLYGAQGVLEETFTGWMTEQYNREFTDNGMIFTTPWYSSCWKITSVIIEAGVAPASTDFWFMYCGSLTSITIYDGLTVIGEDAFFECKNLTSITIPGSVTSIGPFAFSDCDNLKEIIFTGDAPSIGEYAFNLMTATAYYPAGNDTWTAAAKQNYKGNVVWLAYENELPKACENEHVFEDTEYVLTCTEDGYTLHTCINCGGSYVDNYFHALGHNYMPTVIAPTCTNKGYTDHVCGNCGASYITDVVDPLGHQYETIVTSPTCTEGGYTTNICSTCGNSYVDNHTEPTGHIWDDGVVTREPTTEAEGEKTFTCSVCGEQRTETIGKKEDVIYDVPEDDTVEIPDNDCFEGGTTVTVEKIEEGDTYTTIVTVMANVAEKFVAFEFTAVKDEAAVQPNGKLTVTFSIPAGYSNDVVVYYMDEQGVLTKLDGVVNVDERTITVELEHFSTYILADPVESSDVMIGDVNGDGRINTRDARALLTYVAGLTKDGDTLNIAAADCNGDGRVNTRDARILLLYVVGLAELVIPK